METVGSLSAFLGWCKARAFLPEFHLSSPRVGKAEGEGRSRPGSQETWVRASRPLCDCREMVFPLSASVFLAPNSPHSCEFIQLSVVMKSLDLPGLNPVFSID